MSDEGGAAVTRHTAVKKGFSESLARSPSALAAIGLAGVVCSMVPATTDEEGSSMTASGYQSDVTEDCPAVGQEGRYKKAWMVTLEIHAAMNIRTRPCTIAMLLKFLILIRRYISSTHQISPPLCPSDLVFRQC